MAKISKSTLHHKVTVVAKRFRVSIFTVKKWLIHPKIIEGMIKKLRRQRSRVGYKIALLKKLIETDEKIA